MSERVRIVNATGIGRETQIVRVAEDGTETPLPRVRDVVLRFPLDGFVEADVLLLGTPVDVVGDATITTACPMCLRPLPDDEEPA